MHVQEYIYEFVPMFMLMFVSLCILFVDMRKYACMYVYVMYVYIYMYVCVPTYLSLDRVRS